MSDLLQLQKLLAPHKQKITTMSTDDATLKRYIIASTSVQEACDRILATDKWRREVPVKDVTIESKGVQKIIDMKSCVLCDEKDVAGRPVVYVAVRNHSMKDRCLEEYTNFIIYSLELGLSKCNKDMENLCIIFDLRGFSLAVMDYPVVKKLFDIMQDHYPERMGVTLVINSPLIFQACWAIIKPWLDENSVNKIKFINNDDLGSYIDPKIIPNI